MSMVMDRGSDEDGVLPGGVRAGELMAAVEDNRRLVASRLADYPWAVDEVMADLAIEVFGALERWSRYERRESLASLANKLARDVVARWFERDRPKHRSGLTFVPGLHRMEPPVEVARSAAGRRDVYGGRGARSRDDRFALCADTSDEPLLTDRLSYRLWAGDAGGGAGDAAWDLPVDVEDMGALCSLVRARWGARAWRRVVSRALTGVKQDVLRMEIRHWLLCWHQGRHPTFEGYPAIVQAASGGRVSRARDVYGQDTSGRVAGPDAGGGPQGGGCDSSDGPCRFSGEEQ